MSERNPKSQIPSAFAWLRRDKNPKQWGRMGIVWLMLVGVCGAQEVYSPYNPDPAPVAAGGGGGGSLAVQSFGSFSTTSLAVPFTNNITIAGANAVLFVHVGTGDSQFVDSISSVTFNGVSMTRLWSTNNANWVNSTGWILVAPATGTHELIAQPANVMDQVGVNWMNVTNANQSTPNGTVATGKGTTGNPSVVVSSATGELVVSGVSSDGQNTLTVSTGGLVTRVQNVGADTDYGVSTNAGAASVTMSWTHSGELGWAMGGVAIKP